MQIDSNMGHLTTHQSTIKNNSVMLKKAMTHYFSSASSLRINLGITSAFALSLYFPANAYYFSNKNSNDSVRFTLGLKLLMMIVMIKSQLFTHQQNAVTTLFSIK